MKLLHKITRDYLVASVSILVITGMALFAMLKKEVADEMDEQLILQTEQLFGNAAAGYLVDTPFLKISKLTPGAPKGRMFGDTMIFDPVQQEIEEYHFLRESRVVGADRYEVLAMTSHIGWDRYYLAIIYIFLLVAVLLTICGVLINYLSNRKIWASFFANIKTIQDFSVSSADPLSLRESSISEFKQLNTALQDLTARSRKEYLALRSFTENASHEIQTPVSIIQSKLDRMSQVDIDLTMSHLILDAKSGADRLSKMSKSLLLLAKLDNQVFDNLQEIEMDQIIRHELLNVADLFAGKQIVVKDVLESTRVVSDTFLAETLCLNLLSNAFKYTPVNGEVNIVLSERVLTVSNTGVQTGFPADQIFQRFAKNPEHIHATGLGLSIVWEICQLSRWDISYEFSEGWHRFKVELGAHR